MKIQFLLLCIFLSAISFSQVIVKSPFALKGMTYITPTVATSNGINVVTLNFRQELLPVSKPQKDYIDTKATKADLATLQRVVTAQAASMNNLTSALKLLKDSVYKMQSQLSRPTIQDSSKVQALRQELSDTRFTLTKSLETIRVSLKEKENVLPWTKFSDKFRVTQDSVIHIDIR